jgi:hypothetical protein
MTWDFPLLVSHYASTRDFCPALAALVDPFISSSYTISLDLSPSPSRKGRKSWLQGGNPPPPPTILYAKRRQVEII